MSNNALSYDVAIVGGGPGGATTASLLRKYNPNLSVAIIEREPFPREHVGESQLPPIGRVLNEMGVWDKIEAAGFPIKLGATYTWGNTKEPWVFGFIPTSEVGDLSRPGNYAGWRERVALQVDRAKYDTILLEHARSLGTQVLQPKAVTKVVTSDGERSRCIEGLELDNGETIQARYYVDASGNAAVLRRGLGIEVEALTLLKNVAFWDYWEGPKLNASLMEMGTARVMIRSVSFGWLWFIILSENRTSVGLVCNADYYKRSGKKPIELYELAIEQEPQIRELLLHANRTCQFKTAMDWSYVANQTVGENWFLVGESLGFADPILAAGLTLTHTCAQHCACTILELDRNRLDPNWLRTQYHEIQTRRVRQHMKFAEYWYSANGLFDSILENCASIAKQSGLELSPQEAFRWLSHGGIDDVPGQFVIGGLGLAGIKSVQRRLSHSGSEEVEYLIDDKNVFEIDLADSTVDSMAVTREGAIEKVQVLRRGESRWPIVDVYGIVYQALKAGSDVEVLIGAIRSIITQRIQENGLRKIAFQQSISCLEALAAQGWIRCSKIEGKATLSIHAPMEGEIIYSENAKPKQALS